MVGLISAAVLSVTIGIGVAIRQGNRAHTLQEVGAAQSRELTQLSEALAAQGERERLAREIHDALGHRLSLLSLHAGALEVAAGAADPRLARSAAQVRENAQQSMTDLRTLLSMLRDPSAPDVAAAVPGLDDLPRLIDESLAAGSPVVSAVYVDSSAALEPVLGRTAYRITQAADQRASACAGGTYPVAPERLSGHGHRDLDREPVARQRSCRGTPRQRPGRPARAGHARRRPVAGMGR